MSNVPNDIYAVIERTKHIDPDAFRMIIGADGMPAGFVDPDESRRNEAYVLACTELQLPAHLRLASPKPQANPG